MYSDKIQDSKKRERQNENGNDYSSTVEQSTKNESSNQDSKRQKIESKVDPKAKNNSTTTTTTSSTPDVVVVVNAEKHAGTPYAKTNSSQMPVFDPLHPYWKKPLESWSVQQLRHWFSISEFASLSEKFNALSGLSLAELGKETFESIGIQGIALYNAIQKMRRGYQRETYDSLALLLPILRTEILDSSNQKTPSTNVSNSTSMQPQEIDAAALGYPEFKFKSFLGRQRTISRFTDGVGELWRAYLANESTPSIHPSLILTNGIGSGKSRFARESIDSLKKEVVVRSLAKSARTDRDIWKEFAPVALHSSSLVLVGFDEGADPLTSNDFQVGPDVALGLRIAARGLFGVPLSKLVSKLRPSEFKLFDSHSILSIFAKQRFEHQQKQPKGLVTSLKHHMLVIHLDDIHVAHSMASKNDQPLFINTMIGRLVDYRSRSKHGFQDGLFVVPLATSTNQNGIQDLHWIDLPLTPLSLAQSLKLLEEEHGDSYLLRDISFCRCLLDLGIIPRALHILSFYLTPAVGTFWTKEIPSSTTPASTAVGVAHAATVTLFGNDSNVDRTTAMAAALANANTAIPIADLVSGLFGEVRRSLHLNGFPQIEKMMPSALSVQHLFSHAMLRIPYFWNDLTDKNSPLQFFSDVGLLYTKPKPADDDEEALHVPGAHPEPLFLFVPTFLLHWWASFHQNVYSLALLSELARFPPASVRESSKWNSFLIQFFGLCAVKASLGAFTKSTTVHVRDLFPGIGPDEIMLDELSLKSLYLVKEDRTWINKLQHRNDVTAVTHDDVPFVDQLHQGKGHTKVSDAKNWFISADNNVDIQGRVVIERVGEGKKPYLFVFQLHSSGGSTVTKRVTIEQLRKRVEFIQRAYSVNRYVVVGVLVFSSTSAGYSNAQDLKEFVLSQKNIILIGTESIPKASPGVAHRMLTSDSLDVLLEK